MFFVFHDCSGALKVRKQYGMVLCRYNLTVHLPSFCQIKIGSSANTSEAAPVNMSDVAESSAKTVQESNSGTIQKEQEQAPYVGRDTGQSKLEALITHLRRPGTKL